VGIKSRRMRCTGHVECTGERRGAYRILVGRPQERRPFGRPIHAWEDNTEMDLEEISWAWCVLI
jgi:hypothetical protein